VGKRIQGDAKEHGRPFSPLRKTLPVEEKRGEDDHDRKLNKQSSKEREASLAVTSRKGKKKEKALWCSLSFLSGIRHR